MVEFMTLFAAGGTVGTGVGIATTAYYHRQTKRMIEEKRRIGWADLRDEARALNTRIEAAFDPEIIVTPGMRGATVANLMRDVYESVLLYIGVREDIRDGATGLESQPKNYVGLPATNKYRHFLPESLGEVTENRVLILDAFTDTGQSLSSIEEHLLDRGFPAARIRRATVYCSHQAVEDGNDPDFYALEVSRPFYFPWGKAV